MAYKKCKKVKTPQIVSTVVMTKESPKEVVQQPALTHKQKSKSFLRHLNKHFAVFQKHQPLMIDVSKELYSIFDNTPHRIINTALYFHTHTKKYLKNLSKCQDRVDLAGQFVSRTDMVSAKKAKEKLKILFKKTSI